METLNCTDFDIPVQMLKTSAVISSKLVNMCDCVSLSKMQGKNHQKAQFPLVWKVLLFLTRRSMHRSCAVIIIVSRLSLWRGANALTSALKLLLLQIFVIDSVDETKLPYHLFDQTKSLRFVIISLAVPVGSVRRILFSDWLLKRARWPISQCWRFSRKNSAKGG